jgi:hypothetical protein
MDRDLVIWNATSRSVERNPTKWVPLNCKDTVYRQAFATVANGVETAPTSSGKSVE